MKAEEARDEIKRRWRELWPHDKGKGENQGVICPLCQNGSGADGDGVKQDRRKEGLFLHCFKCGFNGDAITLLEKELHAGYRQALEEGAKRLSLSVEWKNGGTAALKPPAQTSGNRAGSPAKPPTGTNYHAGEEKPLKMDFSPFIESARAGLEDERAREYLERRGISIETAAAYRLGYVAEWTNPATGRKQSGGRLIVPFAGDCGYLARSIGGDEKGAKQNGGAVGLFGDALKGSGVVFIVEGWADALSIIEAGKENGAEYHAIALNGAANGSKLIEAAADFSGVFLIALDADEAGRKAAEKLSAMMQEAGFLFSVADLCGGCKDENEFLVMDRAGFSFACLEAHETATAVAEQAARPDSIEAYITGGGWREDVERGKQNREKTGFPALDDWLGGGLYEGLTVISGFPSLGKTSLLWQIGENVAATGCHVIFFSLEMSRADMLAKSLSRRAFANGRDVTSDDAQSGRDDCSRELKEILQDVGARLEVVEGSFGYGIEAIRKRAILAKRRGGRLCVFVDYLQAAADYKGGGSEITAISDTAKAFRQLARELHCPIVCASSTARTNYNSAVDLGVFYGSGGIESAADCAAGLQLSAVYSREYIDAGRERQGGKDKQASIIDKAAAESPRGVSFIGLKNRRGQMKKRIDFLFDARHCTFSEKAGDVFENECDDEIPFSDDELSFLSAAPQSAGG